MHPNKTYIHKKTHHTMSTQIEYIRPIRITGDRQHMQSSNNNVSAIRVEHEFLRKGVVTEAINTWWFIPTSHYIEGISNTTRGGLAIFIILDHQANNLKLGEPDVFSQRLGGTFALSLAEAKALAIGEPIKGHLLHQQNNWEKIDREVTIQMSFVQNDTGGNLGTYILEKFEMEMPQPAQKQSIELQGLVNSLKNSRLHFSHRTRARKQPTKYTGRYRSK